MDCIIIDNGSQTTKYGRASWVVRTKDGADLKQEPKTCPTCLSVAKYANMWHPEKEEKVGEYSKAIYDRIYPTEKGIIGNFEDAEKIWTSVLKELNFNSDMESVLITSTCLAPPAQAEKIAQIYFENLNVPRFFICSPEFLSLVANSKETGLVVHFGRAITSYTPVVYNSVAKYKATDQILGMLDVEDFIRTKLNIQDEKEIEAYKDKLNTYPNNNTGGKYVLPDNTKLEINLLPSEIFFNPSVANKNDTKGVVEFTNDFLKDFDPIWRKDMIRNILVTGKTSKIKGFDERFHNDFTNILEPEYKSCFVPFHDINKTFSPFIGGAFMSQLLSAGHNWITRTDYMEGGVRRQLYGFC